MLPISSGLERAPFSSRLPVAAVESVRTERIERAVFTHVTIVQVLEGRACIQTPSGTVELRPGMAMALGAERWCTVQPAPRVRMWTIFLDEEFLRTNMRWVLADATRVWPGTHPDSWNGSALVLDPGVEMLRRAEPFWRQISMLSNGALPELNAARMIGLFAGAVEVMLPALLAPNAKAAPRPPFPLTGRLTACAVNRAVRYAAVALRDRLDEQWTVTRLASEVALSRAHLTRAFVQQLGLAPMRFLTEARLTEFSRLIEETDQPIGLAAQQVGWSDARVATSWFQRKFGLTPTEYRRHPHPMRTADANCELCRTDVAVSMQPTRTREMTRDSRRDAQTRPIH
jgi:AraC family transcriptional regulator